MTGAGGSIGSELCRQIAQFEPAELIMLDRDESALHAVQLSISGRALLDTPDLVLLDIRDPRACQAALPASAGPTSCSTPPRSSTCRCSSRTRSRASRPTCGARSPCSKRAEASGVECFVNVSTDKAADPCSMLGYSKRVAEGLTAGVDERATGRYLSVRFGNVLGSRGSVLTAFQKQLELGGPLTVTHRDVTRFFMTVEEAVQLVLQAGAIGEGGSVLVLDMGDPVSIAEVAEQLAQHASSRRARSSSSACGTARRCTRSSSARPRPTSQTAHPLIRSVGVPALRRRLRPPLPGHDQQRARPPTH